MYAHGLKRPSLTRKQATFRSLVSSSLWKSLASHGILITVRILVRSVISFYYELTMTGQRLPGHCYQIPSTVTSYAISSQSHEEVSTIRAHGF